MKQLDEYRLTIERGEIDAVTELLTGDIDEASSPDRTERLVLQAEILYRKGDYRRAIETLVKSRDSAEHFNRKRLTHLIMNHLVWIGLKAGIRRKVHETFNELEKEQRIMDNHSKALFYLNHAFAVSMDIGFIESAKFSDRLIKDAMASLKEAERKGGGKDPVLKLRTRLVRAILLQQTGEWDQARSVLEKAVSSSEEDRYVFMRADLLEELGNLHLRQGEEIRTIDPDGAADVFDRAEKAFNDALGIWEGRNRDQEGVLNSALGDAHFRQGEYESAWDHHSTALDIFEELDYPHGKGLQQMALGRVALRMGEARDGISRLKKARKIFKKLDVRHERVQVQVHLVDGYFLLSRRKGKRALKKLLYNEPVKRYLDCYRELREIVTREDWLKEDPDLKELFERPPPRYITLELLEQIIQAARKAHPNEFGGLIHGDPIMDRLEFVLDSARGKDTFMFSLYNRYSGDYIYSDGSVHSHPSGAAIPSKADLSFFGKFPSVNIIMGYPYALDSWAAYDRNGNKVKVSVIYRDDKDKVQAQLDRLKSSAVRSGTKEE